MDDNNSAVKQVVDGLLNYFQKSSISKEELESYVSNSINKSKEESSTVRNITKKFDDEEMIAIEPLYVNIGEADVHKDGVRDEDLDQLVENFNENIDNILSKVHHSFETDGFYPLKAYRLPMDVYVGDPDSPEDLILIEEGQPVVKMQFTNKDYWEKRKNGQLASVSIGCKAVREENPDYEGDE